MLNILVISLYRQAGLSKPVIVLIVCALGVKLSQVKVSDK